MIDLFGDDAAREIVPGMLYLPRFCDTAESLAALEEVLAQAPLRAMSVPGGKRMSVMTSSAGKFGWTSDGRGYRYSTRDPLSEATWPAMPEVWRSAAQRAAQIAGYVAFVPDACLINRYAPNAKMGLHQDRNEADFSQPIVSFSFGATADFFFTLGNERRGPTKSLTLRDGDALVFGGSARLLFHGVKPLRADGNFTGRINLTFRRVDAVGIEHGGEFSA